MFVMLRSACVVMAAAIWTPASAVTLFEDDFEANAPGRDATPAGWVVARGSVDLLGPGLRPEQCFGGGVCLDLFGELGPAGTIRSVQDFTLKTNVLYTLTFDYAWFSETRELRNTLQYGVGSRSAGFGGIGLGPAEPRRASMTFIGDGTVAAIHFEQYDRDGGGYVIDNVRLVEGAVVPLPAAGWMSLSALAALWAAGRVGPRWRRRAAK